MDLQTIVLTVVFDEKSDVVGKRDKGQDTMPKPMMRLRQGPPMPPMRAGPGGPTSGQR